MPVTPVTPRTLLEQLLASKVCPVTDSVAVPGAAGLSVTLAVKTEEVLKHWATPLGAPAYPRGPYRFTDREYLNIVYRTDPEALRAVVPEPLEIAEPLVRFGIFRNLGGYILTGAALVVPIWLLIRLSKGR